METIPPSPLYRMLLWLAVAMPVVGCATWKETPPLDSTLGARKLPVMENRKQIVLDVEFVNMDVEGVDLDQQASLWQWVDETPIDVTARRRFFANGIRVGLVSNPERFRDRLRSLAADQNVTDEFLSAAAVASDVSRGDKRIPMQIGRRYELPLHQPIEGSHVAMVRLDGKTVGRTLANPQYLFAIQPVESTGQKQVHLRFRPEIQHGEMRQKWVGSDSAIRIDRRRESWSLPLLDLDIAASEGDIIVIAPTTPLAGLAKQMLSGTNAENLQEQVVLLVRVLQVPSAVDRL